MSRFLFLALALIAVFGAGSGLADVREIRAFEAEQKQLALEQDALAGGGIGRQRAQGSEDGVGRLLAEVQRNPFSWCELSAPPLGVCFS